MKRTIQVRIFRGEQQYVAECLEGEDLAEMGFAADPTILATLELQAVA